MRRAAPTQIPVGPPPRRGSAAFATLSLAMLLSSLGMSIANVGLPALMDAFSASYAEAQWIVLAYLLAVTSLAVGAGRLADLLGRRAVMLAGLALFAVASLLCGLAGALWQLLLARAAQGIGAAAMMVLAMAMVGDAVPRERTGRAIGMLGTLSAVGTAAGPALGGLLLARFGWPALFLIGAPLGLLALCLGWRHLPQDRRTTVPPRFDAAGALVLALALAAYALGMTAGGRGFGLINLLVLAGAAAGLVLFWRIEARSVSPLVRVETLRDPTVARGLALNALVMTIPMTTLVVGPFYLSRALGLGAASVGLTMSAGPIAAALSGVPSGRAVDRHGARTTALAGLAAMTLACVLLALAPQALGVLGYVLPLVMLTSGYALFQAANATTLMQRAAPEERGSLSGLLQLSRNLGMITGASLMGTLFGHAAEVFAGTVPSAAAQAMRLTFCVAAVLAFSAVMIGSRIPATARAGA